MKDAQGQLANADIGECILRPSSKGVSHLSITMKFYQGVYFHTDIKEGPKGSKGGAQLRLGLPLTIGKESYEDLDEV